MIESYKHADVSILRLARLFAQARIECGFLAPPGTALRKAIVDAILPIRKLFQLNSFHNYDAQHQGPEHKIIRECWIISGSEKVKKRISLYRPNTKTGDPRLWISNLHKIIHPNNVIGLFFWQGVLYVINCSTCDIEAELEDPKTILGQIKLGALRANPSESVATELLTRLKEIGKRGPIKSMKNGATGVGFTLESLLGIEANSKPTPDYKGIELKSARSISAKGIHRPRDRTTLFAKSPSRSLSPISASQALDRFGYQSEDSERQQLYCSIDSEKRNSLGFILAHRLENEHLLARNNRNSRSIDEEIFTWQLETLKNAFRKKHRETFWVGAKTETRSNTEWFHYKKVRHTQDPSTYVFEICLLTGGIGVDLTMSRTPTGGVDDHGYLFRVKRSSFGDLFPEPKHYDIG